MPMGGCAAEGGARRWWGVGWIAGYRADWGAVGVAMSDRVWYHCSVGTKEPRASREAADGRQKGYKMATATAVAERTETAGAAGATAADTNGKVVGVGQAPAGPPAAEAKAPKTLAGVYVQTPPELRGKLEEVAAQAGVTPQVWVRDHLAQEFGVVLPPVTKRVKYASEEEKKTALKERSKAKNELIKKLLADYQAAQAGKEGAGASSAA
jgi:hypothetical protein